MIFLGVRFFPYSSWLLKHIRYGRIKQSQIYLNPRRAISEANTTKIEGIRFSMIRSDELDELEGRRIGESAT